MDDDAGADVAAGAGNAPKRHMLTHAPAGCMLAGPMYMTWQKPRLGKPEYQAWFCQQLGLEPPCLTAHLGQPCQCGLYTIDADHLHTCKIHSGNWYAAHEHLLSAVEEIVRISGYRVKRRYVDSSKGGKTRGDLQLNLQIGNQRQTVVDVAMVHDFHGAVDNPGSHGQPRHPHNPDRVLIDAAKRKVSHYRRDYQRLDTAFVPLIASTSGRLHAEFVRLLYFFAHQRALAFFAKIGQQNPSRIFVNVAVPSAISTAHVSASLAPRLVHSVLAAAFLLAVVRCRCKADGWMSSTSIRTSSGDRACPPPPTSPPSPLYHPSFDPPSSSMARLSG